MDDNILYINQSVSIPRPELRFRYSKSSGPGGQHVQKSSTRVELLFDVRNSPSLSSKQRYRVLERLSSYIDSESILHLTSQSERSQYQNREEVVDRFQKLMQEALKRRKHRKKTEPTAASQEKRLRNKKYHGQKKQLRGKVSRYE